MATDKRISELPVLGTPTRADVLTALGDGGLNVQAPTSDFLGLVNDTDLNFTDNTTGDASTGAHGYMPKIPTGAVPGMLLGLTVYNPSTLTDVATVSTAGENIDATNLTVTFTVPSSGRVLVALSALAYTSGGDQYWWCLRTTGGANVSGTKGLTTSATFGTKIYHRVLVTGLTPAASVTYRWGHGVNTATGHIRYGDDGSTSPRGPAVMEVWAA